MLVDVLVLWRTRFITRRIGIRSIAILAFRYREISLSKPEEEIDALGRRVVILLRMTQREALAGLRCSPRETINRFDRLFWSTLWRLAKPSTRHLRLTRLTCEPCRTRLRPVCLNAVSKNVEIASYRPGSSPADPVEHFTIGNVGFYNNTGRTEVNPIPTNPEATTAGIRYRFGAYPFLEPSAMRGFGFIRYRSIDPKIEDNSWMLNPRSRRVNRASATELSDVLGIYQPGAGAGAGAATYASNLDPDSFFGFAAKIEDFNYKFFGEKPMLAVVNAENSPAKACPSDGGRTVCPENWEMRQLYVIEADAKQTSLLGSGVSIPKRIFYIDSEGWFITASDQYDHDGKLWKTVATFNAYRDRPIPDARVAIWPFKRMFQTALVDEDIVTGFSTVALSPGFETDEHESWYINMGIATDNFFNPATMANAGH